MTLERSFLMVDCVYYRFARLRTESILFFCNTHTSTLPDPSSRLSKKELTIVIIETTLALLEAFETLSN